MSVLWEGKFNPTRSFLASLMSCLGGGTAGNGLVDYSGVAGGALSITAMAHETFTLLQALPRTTTIIRTLPNAQFRRETREHDAHAVTAAAIRTSGGEEWRDPDAEGFPFEDVTRKSSFRILIRLKEDQGEGADGRLAYSQGQLVQILNHELHVHGLEYAWAIRQLHDTGQGFEPIWRGRVADAGIQHLRFVAEESHPTMCHYMRARARFFWWSSCFGKESLWSDYKVQEATDLANNSRATATPASWGHRTLDRQQARAAIDATCD